MHATSIGTGAGDSFNAVFYVLDCPTLLLMTRWIACVCSVPIRLSNRGIAGWPNFDDARDVLRQYGAASLVLNPDQMKG